MAYTLLNRDDPSVECCRGSFYKMRRGLGTTAFGINEVRLPPGVEGHEHTEEDTGYEEVYVIVGGSGTLTIDGAVEVTVGDYLRVDPGSTRLVVAGDEGLAFIAVGGKPLREYDGHASL